ncbi:hypothetical protein M8C21_001459 [Ambrosia artemisiifolia]|uniref:Uncharacterized protein n=1 Tax=Ambrosia artemisiifolia TaxID=4212 RepID=A0AAD5BV22_AMBAR|nr:hypothetical protein M8C21_001459 [Ambrosia artemisiifolia]
MRKLSSNDETFHLSSTLISDVILVVRSWSPPPTPEEYMQWDEYAISFFLKMCTCHGVDYQRLEAFSEDDCGNKPPLSSTSFKQQEEHTESSGVNQPSKEEHFKKWKRMKIGFCRPVLRGPIEFGSYNPGTSPDRVPYHLYLLLKEAVDIMMRPNWKNNANDLIDLTRVEDKIRFFCHYFQSHLPTCWD